MAGGRNRAGPNCRDGCPASSLRCLYYVALVARIWAVVVVRFAPIGPTGGKVRGRDLFVKVDAGDGETAAAFFDPKV